VSKHLDSNPNNDSDFDISKRVTQRMRQGKVDDQILEILQQAFEKALEQERNILSRPERIRLFRQSMKEILTGLLAKMDSDK